MTSDVVAKRDSLRVVTAVRSLVERLGADTLGTSERRSLLLYAAYTLVLFLLCFLATFPHDLVLQRAIHQATADTAITVEAEGAGLAWARYAVDTLRVRMRDGGDEPLLLAEQLRFSPSLLGAFRGNPYPLGIGASLYGGTVSGTIDPRPASFRIDAAVTDVDLARWTGARPLVEGALRGRLQARIAVDGDGRGPAAAAGDVEIRLPGLALEGGKIRGITVPDLHFGDVHLTGTVKNGRLEIGELVADGQEVGVRGEGNVLLRAPLEMSVLSLDLVVTPAATAPDGLQIAVSLLPGSKGEGGARRIGIVGTLARPTIR